MHTLYLAIGLSTLVSVVGSVATQSFLHERIAIFGAFAGLQLSYNSGIAFGIHLGALQDVIIIFALVFMFILALRSASKKREQVGFGLIVGGGLANLIDRWMDGHVTDMIQVGSFPVFNIADALINIGVIVILLGYLPFFSQKEVKEVEDA